MYGTVEAPSRPFPGEHGDFHHGYSDPKPGYDDMPTKLLDMDAQRKELKLPAMAIALAAPIIVFALVSAVLSFSLHHSDPAFTWLVVFLSAAIVAAFCYLYLAVMLVIAWFFGFFVGEINWWSNTLPYNDLHQLSIHMNVDTATTPGQQLMDVGRIKFVQGTKLDLTKSIGFKNVDQYCVVPIIGNSALPDSYDYWAIGLNCCSGNAADFHCGDYSNPNARSGLRLMREDQRAFYQLAVQQAEATYAIKARHPLFFYWMDDAIAELESYQAETVKSYFISLLSFVFAQIFFFVIAVISFTKLL